MAWDMPLLRNVFLPRDVDIIQTIPLSKRRPTDTLIWNGTKSGIFSIKSAYRMLLDNDCASDASTSGGVMIINAGLLFGLRRFSLKCASSFGVLVEAFYPPKRICSVKVSHKLFHVYGVERKQKR